MHGWRHTQKNQMRALSPDAETGRRDAGYLRQNRTFLDSFQTPVALSAVYAFEKRPILGECSFMFRQARQQTPVIRSGKKAGISRPAHYFRRHILRL